MSRVRIVAVGLLTDDDLKRLGPQFSRAYPVAETPCFGELMHAIDEADRDFWRRRDRCENVDQPVDHRIIISPKL